jgi:thymidylate kinase
MKTYLINVIGGPSSGKTTACALLFAKLKIKGFIVEYVQEIAKGLVWAENYDLLDNQFWLSQTQYKALKCLDTKVQFIITDGCLLHGIYYNRNNINNVSNVEKTEKYIIDSFKQFNNINIFIERGHFPYEQIGRIQNEHESKCIDEFFLNFLETNNIPYERHYVENKDSDNYSVDKMISYILAKI